VHDAKKVLQRAKRHDVPALGQIFDRYAEEIYRYIHHGLGDAKLAEDLTVEVFCQMLQAIRYTETDPTALRGWLHRRAAELVAAHLRRLYGRGSRPLGGQCGTGTGSLEDGGGPAHEPAQLRAALGQLPVEQQQVLILKLLDERTTEEVARILDQPQEAVRRLQRRALTTLHSNR
jgi:RNA polymerase sigma-70 factor (ECF subfamily)